jgi:hypothetical protein
VRLCKSTALAGQAKAWTTSMNLRVIQPARILAEFIFVAACFLL